MNTLAIILVLCSNHPDFATWEKKIEKSFATYQKDNSNGDWDKYIGQKIIDHCSGMDANEKDIKTMLFYLAISKKKNVTLPERVREYLKKYEDRIKEDLTWEQLVNGVIEEMKK